MEICRCCTCLPRNSGYSEGLSSEVGIHTATFRHCQGFRLVLNRYNEDDRYKFVQCCSWFNAFVVVCCFYFVKTKRSDSEILVQMFFISDAFSSVELQIKLRFHLWYFCNVWYFYAHFISSDSKKKISKG